MEEEVETIGEVADIDIAATSHVQQKWSKTSSSSSSDQEEEEPAPGKSLLHASSGRSALR